MNILGKACELGQGAVVTVIGTHGSTPRHPGARMLVAADGTSSGTIGGGRVEYEVVQTARGVAGGAPATRVLHHLVRDLAMCCGGSMEFFIQPIAPSVSAFASVVKAQAERTPLVLVTPFDGTPTTTRPFTGGPTRPAIVDDRFIEPILPDPRLILFGCGHVARAVGPLAREVGFKVLVCDDGTTGAVDIAPSWAEAVLPTFEKSDVERALGPFGARDFLVVMTRDHAVDERIVTQLLPLVPSVAYVGVIGSRGKLGRFHKRLAARAPAGFEHWERVHGPIGLDIGAETPEEIAVSLIAELISVKNRVGAA